jgi:hypothetical protein
MSFEGLVLVVLVASPGDTSDGRDLVERAINGWNRDRARRQRVVLLPVRWEADAVPELGVDGQSVINRQLVDECDVVVALFHSRLGAPTPRAISGTVEEIERARERGVPVHVYFSEMPIPRNVDPDELKRLNEYRSMLQGQGLLGSYVSLDDLAAKVRTALEASVDQLINTNVERAKQGPPAGHAILRARYEFDREPHVDSRGVTRMRTIRERLIIENIGNVAAEGVEVTITAAGEGAAPALLVNDPIERLLPQSSVSLLVAVHMGVAPNWRVTLRWREDGVAFEESQTVTAF